MVCIYIFPSNDPQTVQQRIQLAVNGFSNTNNLPIPQAEDLIIARTEAGKPYFPYVPHLHLSISHSGKYWGCAISDETVGFDIQESEQPKNETVDDMYKRHQKMAVRFFHPKEAEFVSQDCRYHFLTVWTAKEAYVKHTGHGIDRYFSEHCVIPETADEQQHIRGNAAEIQWSALGKIFWKSYFGEDYTMCVCTDSPCARIVEAII